MEKVIAEYPPEYCACQELAYGEGMISEGGAEGIEQMFEGVSLEGRRALDVGSGLGGVATYLAREHGMWVTGLDVNPWMIEESMRRRPTNLVEGLNFQRSFSNESLDFPDEHFDIVYSKGALCHVEEKLPLFQELFRVLKRGGVLVINDVVSSLEGDWGEDVQRLIDLDGLTLFAQTEEHYLASLERAGFGEVAVREESELYLRYNEEIIRRCPSFRSKLSAEVYQDFVEGFESIARALKKGDWRVLRFRSQR